MVLTFVYSGSWVILSVSDGIHLAPYNVRNSGWLVSRMSEGKSLKTAQLL